MQTVVKVVKRLDARSPKGSKQPVPASPPVSIPSPNSILIGGGGGGGADGGKPLEVSYSPRTPSKSFLLILCRFPSD